MLVRRVLWVVAGGKMEVVIGAWDILYGGSFYGLIQKLWNSMHIVEIVVDSVFYSLFMGSEVCGAQKYNAAQFQFKSREEERS